MGSSVCGYTLEPVRLNIAKKYSYHIICVSHERGTRSESCLDGVVEMFCHHWLSSPFSCSALLDMESGQLTVTTDVTSLPLVHGPDFKPFVSRACDPSPKVST